MVVVQQDLNDGGNLKLMFMHGTKAAAMKSWRFPGTRQGGNMQKHLSSPGQGQKERNSLDACFVCMAEFSVCNHGVLGKTTVVKRKKKGKKLQCLASSSK